MPKNELAARYEDKGQPPRFGYRIKCGKWSNVHEGGLSVNAVGCACALCAVLLQPDPERYEHAVCITLERLADALGFPLVATYAPLTVEKDGCENPCHFNITPTLETVDALVIGLKHLADRDYPKDRPRTPEDEARSKAAQEALGLIFELTKDVRAIAES